MKSNRYTRLCLVLIAPLLIAGFVAAEKQVFFKLNFFTQCFETEDKFSCYTTQRREDPSQLRGEMGGVWIWPYTYLTDGFNAPVITLGVTKMEYKDGALREAGTEGAGIKKILRVGRFQGANYSSPGSCTLSPFANQETSWVMNCVSGISESFKFVEKTTEAKYQQLRKSLEIINSENESFHKRLYILSVLTPLLSFLAASGIIFCFKKCFSFIWNGRKSAVT